MAGLASWNATIPTSEQFVTQCLDYTHNFPPKSRAVLMQTVCLLIASTLQKRQKISQFISRECPLESGGHD